MRRSKQTLEASEALRAKGDGLQGRVEQLSAELHKQRRALESTAEVVADSNARLDLAHNQLDTQFSSGKDRGGHWRPQNEERPTGGTNPSRCSSSEISEEIKRALDKGDETERSIDRTLSLVQSIHHNLTEIRSYTKEISDLDSSLFQGISDTSKLLASRADATIIQRRELHPRSRDSALLPEPSSGSWAMEWLPKGGF